MAPRATGTVNRTLQQKPLAMRQMKSRRSATAAKSMENTNGIGPVSNRRIKSTGRLTGGSF